MNTSCDPEKRHRRSIRLRNYDYSRAGVYFITVCTKGQELLFGEVNDGEVELSEFGRMAAEEWLNSARIRIEIELDMDCHAEPHSWHRHYCQQTL